MHTAIERGESIGIATMQVFTKNSNQWDGKQLSDEAIRTYKIAEAKSSIAPIVAHAAYLINLCAKDPFILQRSRDGLVDELKRSETLGLLGVIIHPGAHMGTGEEDGIRRIAESLNIAHERTGPIKSLSILETTAGQGSSLGYRFEQLRRMIDGVDRMDRIAVCIDTCHLFAAGYDVRSAKGWEQTMREFDDVIGRNRLVVVHVNDSKREIGSRVDRHEHIGRGAIGLPGFRILMNDERFLHVPKIIETPKSEDMHEDVMNLRVLRSLVNRRGRAVPQAPRGKKSAGANRR